MCICSTTGLKITLLILIHVAAVSFTPFYVKILQAHPAGFQCRTIGEGHYHAG